jgi:hypothetical protein
VRQLSRHPLGNNYSGDNMKKYIIGLLVFFTYGALAQNMEVANKVVRLSTLPTSEILKLDSMYVSAAHVDKAKCAFPDQGDTVYACWKALLHNMATTLEEKKFVWQNDTKIFIRCYFNENGDIDHCLYNTRDTTFVRFQEFENALKDFASNYNFGLKCDKKYVQCGNTVFGKKK